MTNEQALQNPGVADQSTLLDDLYQKYAPQGTQYAYSMLRHISDAEEVTQEAFCRLLAKSADWTVEELESRSQRFPALFFATIRNLCIDQIRKNRRRRHVSLDVSAELVAKPEFDDTRQLEQKLVVAMGEMPSQWSDALNLKINGQLSYDEIAEVLDATHGQIRSWIYRARRHLETELKKAGINTV